MALEYDYKNINNIEGQITDFCNNNGLSGAGWDAVKTVFGKYNDALSKYNTSSSAIMDAFNNALVRIKSCLSGYTGSIPIKDSINFSQEIYIYGQYIKDCKANISNFEQELANASSGTLPSLPKEGISGLKPNISISLPGRSILETTKVTQTAYNGRSAAAIKADIEAENDKLTKYQTYLTFITNLNQIYIEEKKKIDEIVASELQSLAEAINNATN